jgi:hypothetical protein
VDGDVVLPVEMRLLIYAGGAEGGVWGAFGRCADREGRRERVRWRKMWPRQPSRDWSNSRTRAPNCKFTESRGYFLYILVTQLTP